MKDYYNLIIEQALKTNLIDDYQEIKNVKRHNRAMDKLLKLKNEMIIDKDKECCGNILRELLTHSDDRVRLNAAWFGMEMDSPVKAECKAVLEDIKMNSYDKSLRFSAELLLDTDLTKKV